MVHLNKTLNTFWRRWRNEYLLELRESHRHNRGSADAARVSVGDIVVVHSEDQPRGFWNLGRVKEVVIGRDGEARGAVVRVANKGRRSTLLQRPVQRLYPLESTTQALQHYPNPIRPIRSTLYRSDDPQGQQRSKPEIGYGTEPNGQ